MVNNRPYVNFTQLSPVLFKQRYLITSKDGSLDRWNILFPILCEDEEFHHLMNQYGLEIILQPDFKLTIERTYLLNGPQRSELTLKLWKKYEPIFSEYGIILIDSELQP